MTDQKFKHDARFDKLEALDDWELEDSDQDIRGRPLVTAQNEKIGVIEDLLVDKDGERVAAVRLKDGSVCGVEYLQIQSDKVIYAPPASTGKAPQTAPQVPSDRAGNDKIELVEEEVAIGKRAVEGESIRLRTRVVTEPVSKDVTLRDEHIDVKRTQKDDRIDSNKADELFKDRTVTMTEQKEQAVVTKSAHITGEVELSKSAGEHVEHIDETVRRTEVDVERTPAPDKNDSRQKPPRR